MTPLHGHTSEATAVRVEDYPYGKLRCTILFWLEKSDAKGYRFCSRTCNPKSGVWNAVKRSTYCKLAGAIYLDGASHHCWAGLSEYSSAEDCLTFIADFPAADFGMLKTWCLMKAGFCKAGEDGKVSFSVNGERREVSDLHKLEYARELAVWQECIELLKDI